MKTVYAAGIIVYTLQGTHIYYLLLHHTAGHWSLPKGRREEEETDKQTALRELHEETGLIIKNLNESFSLSLSYEVFYNNEYVTKIVTYFVEQVPDTTITLSPEHDQFLWCSFEKAINTLTHQNSKNILEKAHEYIQKNKLDRPGPSK